MKVFGAQIPKQSIDAALKYMGTECNQPFRALNIETVMYHFQPVDGRVSRSTFSRAADRLLQQERKAGRIKHTAKGWVSA